MKLLGFCVVAILAAVGTAQAADMPIPTKAPPLPPGATTCQSAEDFLTTDCVLSYNGITVYGTVDVGVGYQTHGTPFDPNFPTGASYLVAKPSRLSEFGLAPNAMSQSNIGFRVKEPLAGDWSFVGRAELAFDPYSGLLANAPQALQNAIHVPLNQQEYPVDSSRWGWLAAPIYAGVSSPTYGTLTFGRQYSLLLDGVIAYDPMGGSYAFSPIGFSGMTCGAGDTELCRMTTAVKYNVNVANLRFGAMGQFGNISDYNPSNGAVQGDAGGDFHVGPGLLSVDGIGSWAKDVVNIGPTNKGVALNSSGQPLKYPANTILTATVSDQTSFMALAKYAISPLTVYFGYEWIQYAAPSDPQTSFYDDGFLFPVVGQSAINNTAFTAKCGFGTCGDKIVDVFWTGAKYSITKDLDIIGAYYHYYQPQYTTAVCPNPALHGQCVGAFDALSGVIDWRFLPKWDTYFGMMFNQVNGALANGYIQRNNLDPTVGVRFKF